MTSTDSRQPGGNDDVNGAIGMNWSALRVGDPDPEPDVSGVCCDVFVQHPVTGASFDCTRSPHEGDGRHVSCAYWGAMRATDAIVVAVWDDAPEGRTITIASITPAMFDAIERRFNR